MRGFSLIELLIGLLIIGLLASMAVPAYSSYRIRAANSAALSDVKLLVLNELAFYNGFYQYVDFLPGDVGANGLLNKTVNLASGGTTNFTLALSSNVDSLAKVDASAQTVIVAARAKTGDIIIACEVERDNQLKQKPQTTPLTSADVPPSTPAVDLASWANL